MVATACGSDEMICSGRRDAVPVAGHRLEASLTLMVGSPKCSTCCSTGSGDAVGEGVAGEEQERQAVGDARRRPR